MFRTRIVRSLKNFRADSRGNVAMIFAIASLPVLGTVGFAVDYSQANSAKAAMQAALDSTALMLSKDAATLSDAALQVKAKSYFNSLFNRPDATNVSIGATYTASGGSTVVVNGSAEVPTNFLGIMGFNSLTVNGSATSKWGSERLRVALALDNTGSMSSDGKMTALKSATKSLLTQLQSTASTNGDVYVSIIPFAQTVNVGKSNYNANWIDWSDWDDDNGYDSSTTTCANQKSGKNGKNKKKCTTSTTWVPANHNTWNGCVADRDQSYDQTVEAPTGSASTSPSKLFPADQDDNCPVAMMGLNYNWGAMNTLVDSMKPAGMTNQPIGLVWAWQSLVGGGPLTAPPKDSNYKYQDVIILMSDGLNTQNRWSSSQTQVDKRMYDSSKNGAGTCANIKAAGVTIYTIHVNTDNDPTSTLLQNCASSADKFFIVNNSNGLGSVFAAIGTNLTKLRVAK